MLTATGLVELRMAFSHAAVLNFVCLPHHFMLSKSLKKGHMQLYSALIVGSMGMIQRSVF